MTSIAQAQMTPHEGNIFTNPLDFQQYDDDPSIALGSYARVMHDHTMRQMDAARRAARRRSSPSSRAVDAQGPRKESSISSTDSAL